MATGKLTCNVCFDQHKADVKHFPKKLVQMQKGKDGIDKPVIVGYVCRKCAVKVQIAQWKKEAKAKGGSDVKIGEHPKVRRTWLEHLRFLHHKKQGGDPALPR